MTTLFGRLAAHRAIGWDVDGTLIDSPAAPVLHRFIIAHPHIRHVIITFRTHGMQNRVFRDLSSYPTAPKAAMFAAVLNITDAAWLAYSRDDGKRLRGELAGPLTDAERYYRHWKGQTCRTHGLTALVDDRDDQTRDGCLINGVAFFDTAEFIPSSE